MMWILRDSRARSWFFNIGLIVVFIAAWVSDKWPEMSVPAISVACLIVLFQAGFLYFAALQSKNASAGTFDAQSGVPRIAESIVASSVAFAEADAIRLNTLDIITNFQAFYSFEKVDRNLFSNVMSSQPMSWALTSFPDTTADRILSEYRDIRSSENLAVRKYILLPGRAFNVDAGAFTIEHTNDHTIIVIHDSACVTVYNDSISVLHTLDTEIVLQ